MDKTFFLQIFSQRLTWPVMTMIIFFLAESHDYDYDIAKVVSTMDSPTTTIILIVKNIICL